MRLTLREVRFVVDLYPCKDTKQIRMCPNNAKHCAYRNLKNAITYMRTFEHDPATSVSARRNSSKCLALAISAGACSSIHCLMSSGVDIDFSLVPITFHLSCRRIRVEPVWDEHRECRSQYSSSCCVVLICSWACRGRVNC
jgi:hypothetical protein